MLCKISNNTARFIIGYFLKVLMYIIKQIPEDFIVEEQHNYSNKQSGTHVLIVVKKKNLTTMQAINRLAKKIHIKPRLIGFCGNKDKRAITTQSMSIKTADPKKIQILKNWTTNTRSESWMTVTIKGFRDKPLSLGDHKCNKFTVVIRKLIAKEIENLNRYESCKEDHHWEFINFFGRQRFGSQNKRIGVCLIKGMYKEAVQRLLESHTEVAAMQHHLEQHPHDYTGALQCIPVKLLNLFVHSYQSALWNKVAAKCDTQLIPLIGWDTTFTDRCVQQKTEKLLHKDRIVQRDFIFRDLKLSTEGNKRKRIAHAQEVSILYDKDNLNEGKQKATMIFSLDKGCYATVFIKQLYDIIVHKRKIIETP